MPLLNLVRLSGAFVVLADIIAGYGALVLIAGSGGMAARLPYLLAAGLLLYAGLRGWGDVLGAAGDARWRPYRPIPAREITLTGAFLWSSVMTAAGLLCAMMGGYACFRAGGLAVLAGLAHAAGAGRIDWAGPMLAGLCRAGFWAMGIGLHPSLSYLDGSVYHPAAIVGVNAALAAALAAWVEPFAARYLPLSGGAAAGGGPWEAAAAADIPARWMLGCVFMAMALVPALTGWMLPSRGAAWVLGGWLLALVVAGVRALCRPEAERMLQLAAIGWYGGIFLDAGILAGYARYTPVDIWNGWTLLLPAWRDGAWVIGLCCLALPTWRLAGIELRGKRLAMAAGRE